MKPILKDLLQYCTDSRYRFLMNYRFGFYRKLPDKVYLEKKFKALMGYPLDWNNLQTYSEKMQWLKLYDHKPLYTQLVDKYEVKPIIAEQIGEEYIIPTLGVWDSFDDIDFDSLSEQFVLKCTHDSGGIVICKNKAEFNREEARNKINDCLQQNYYDRSREWPYKNVKPRIIAEQYMEDTATGELRDYKFFCFDGEPKALFIATERQLKGEETKFDFFDMEYNHLPFRNGHPNAKEMPEKPERFEEMKVLAAKLSAGFPHVRVDFFECNGKVYFGEMTFYHWSGMMPFEPKEWDKTFGDWLTLPEKTEE